MQSGWSPTVKECSRISRKRLNETDFLCSFRRLVGTGGFSTSLSLNDDADEHTERASNSGSFSTISSFRSKGAVKSPIRGKSDHAKELLTSCDSCVENEIVRVGPSFKREERVMLLVKVVACVLLLLL